MSINKILQTDRAPQAIGPYSQGVSAGQLLFTSGQLPVCMADGHLELDDIAQATRYCLENLLAVLDAGGAKAEDIVKVTVFLTDLGDFAAMNEVYATFFPQHPPARSCVQVAALPKGAPIEIEAMALRG